MKQPKIGIVFYSKQGNTSSLAKHIEEGIQSQDIPVMSIKIQDNDIVAGRYQNSAIFDMLVGCDAIVFGSPTYMGSPAAQFKAFMDASSDCYVAKAWRNKIAAGFTSGGSLNGEQQQTLLAMFALACQHGMLWAGLDVSQFTDTLNLNRTGSSLGLVASPQPNHQQIEDNDLATAFYFGQRIAKLVK
ncbi:flavodoxin family protein [Vibrio sp. AK197]